MNKEYQKGLVSICCLGYKHKKFLTDCIESIWEQDYKNIEIIAMDDGSKDGSDELLDELSSKSPFPMKVLKQENTGKVGLNFNKLINYANGEFILFSSLDDFFTNTSISDKIYDMQKDESVVFNAPIINYNVQNGYEISRKTLHNGIVLKEKSPLYELQEVDIDELLNVEYNNFGSFYIQGVLFKTQAIDDIGGFDEDMIGDDIVLRTKIFIYIKNNKLKFLLTNKVGIYYRMHLDNIHKNSYRQILIITQWLDRYFKEKQNPKLLKEWLVYSLKTYEKYKVSNCLRYKKIQRLQQYSFIIYYYCIKYVFLNIIFYRYIEMFLKNIFTIYNVNSNNKKTKYLKIFGFNIKLFDKKTNSRYE